jgi:hypothetical protein
MLPRFYVSVVFHEFAPDEFFMGGEPAERFVWISIDQVDGPVPPGARPALGDPHRNTPTEFWTIDGILPPPAGSADERRWAEEDKPSPLVGEPA